MLTEISAASSAIGETANRLPKVAIVSHTHPSLSKGGAEIATYALFRGLRQIGVDAIYICACNIADRPRLALADKNEFGVYYDGERYDHFYHLAPRPAVDQLVQIIRREKIGIVNFHHFLNLGLNSLRAVRGLEGLHCFFTFHEFLAICHHHGQMITKPKQLLCMEATPEACVACYPEHLRSEFGLRKENILSTFRNFDGFISPSRFLASRYAEWGLPSDRMAVIENGLLHADRQSHTRVDRSTWTFGFFGQINPFKGVDVILETAELLARDRALAETTRVRIHGNIVGQSQDFAERFERALKKYPFLSYAGPYNNTSVRQLMLECDYVVIPSKWWENSPLVIQEAYSADVPVICSGIGGMAEKVPDGISGLHFRVGDAADLLRAIRVAANAEKADTLRQGIPSVPSAADMGASYAAFFLSKIETSPTTDIEKSSLENDSGSY